MGYLIPNTLVIPLMTRLKLLSKITREMSVEKEIRERREGNGNQIEQKGHV